MKKIFFILTATVALSMAWGFSSTRSARSVAGNTSSHAVRFNIEGPVYAGYSLPAQIRVVNKITGAVAYNELTLLTRENGKYVTGPIILNEGKYDVEAIMQLPGGERNIFTNMDELVLSQQARATN